MDITIVLPISRRDFLHQVFARLELLSCDRAYTNIITYVDSNDHQLFQEARNFTVNSKFNERLCVFRAKGEPSVGSVYRRRERIADIHNEIKEKINRADYILLIEDDTLIPTDTLAKLLPMAQESLNTAIVSGVQIGRWGYRHIGAWTTNDVYETTEITSLPMGQGIRQVDGAGLYCTLVRKNIYMAHDFQPFETGLGPDFNFGIQMRRAGYKNYIHYNVQCDHLTKKETISFRDGKIDQVQLKKNDKNEWALSLLLPQ